VWFVVRWIFDWAGMVGKKRLSDEDWIAFGFCFQSLRINGERVYIYTGSKTLIAEFRCNMNRYR
jgi:hypothetical protein